MAERLGGPAVAAYLRIKPSTWRAFVARNQAPPPDGIDDAFGRQYWLKSTLDKWKASRPGHGGRPPKPKEE